MIEIALYKYIVVLLDGKISFSLGLCQLTRLNFSVLAVFPGVKVHLTPKKFFRLNNSLHLFETHCAFLPLFSPNLDFLQGVKVTKSDHHLFHDRASKGYGSIPGLMSQTYLHACLQRLNTMQISL